MMAEQNDTGAISEAVREYSKKDLYLKATGIVILSVLFGIFFLLVLDQVINWLNLAYNMSRGNVAIAVAGGLFCFLAGLGGYIVRERRRLLYASVEIGIAMVTGGAAVYSGFSASTSAWGALFAFFGAIYVAVRGFDNLYKVIEPPPFFAKAKS